MSKRDGLIREYVRGLLREFSTDDDDLNGVKINSGGLPPIFSDTGPKGGPEDESYRDLIKEYAWRIYLGIYGGYRPILVSGYDSKSDSDPTRSEVQQALEHAAEYTGEALDFFRKKSQRVAFEKQRLIEAISAKILQFEEPITDLENKMKLSAASGKGDVGKRKITILKDNITKLKGIIKNLNSLEAADVWALNLAVKSVKELIPDYTEDKTFSNNLEYKGIGASEGYEWAHKNDSTMSFMYQPRQLKEKLAKSGKLPGAHKIADDVIKAFKKYGGIGFKESYKLGNIVDLMKKVNHPGLDKSEREPQGYVHNKDAYEFAIQLRKTVGEQEYYDRHMDDRMKRHRGG